MIKDNLKFLFLALIFGFIFPSESVFAVIKGSAHDFSNEAWNLSGQLCITCHTPHNSDTTVAEAPLWNHTVTNSNYVLYTSPTLDVSLNQPSGISKLCLSCHDGTVALDSFGGNAGTTYITGKALLGTNLSNDHPISFTYDANLAVTDRELANPSTTMTSLGETIERGMLFNGKMECASCHDVHNTIAQGNPSLLIINNTGSALCLTCHLK